MCLVAHKLTKESCIEVDAATELMKAGMFESELQEGQIVTPDENELTPRNQITCISPMKPRKSSNILQIDSSKVRKKLYFPNF